ncbi:MAG: tRNA epoxyqueuosine(34) reductase QueG [Bryobacteraceae bacterium]|nr:tRNA epoxyqueuosine(34) reductase QueG [Bryobacteraceae bacterium]
MQSEEVKRLARGCGFQLAGIAPVEPVREAGFFLDWAARGLAGAMSYLTDRRAEIRHSARSLLASARSVICVGKLYNAPLPYSTRFDEPERAWISRYAWGDDYHEVLRRGLTQLLERLKQIAAEPFEAKICVDTAPLLERAHAHRAGLGWIGKNTCLINQQQGSWFFLGELLVSLDLEPDTTPPDRCGSCTRCIDACPTEALVPVIYPGGPRYELDSRRCISYFTIEHRGGVPEEHRPGLGHHLFGCDICQDVCPWNRAAPETTEEWCQPREFAPPLNKFAAITETEFQNMFRGSPLKRARYTGFLRNVAIAMGNSGHPGFRNPLMALTGSPDAVVAETAEWALGQLR